MGYEICPRCSGTGKITIIYITLDIKQKCSKCNGEGLIE